MRPKSDHSVNAATRVRRFEIVEHNHSWPRLRGCQGILVSCDPGFLLHESSTTCCVTARFPDSKQTSSPETWFKRPCSWWIVARPTRDHQDTRISGASLVVTIACTRQSTCTMRHGSRIDLFCHACNGIEAPGHVEGRPIVQASHLADDRGIPASEPSMQSARAHCERFSM